MSKQYCFRRTNNHISFALAYRMGRPFLSIFGSSVKYPAMDAGADHPLPPECQDGQQSSADPHGRTESTATGEQPVGGNSSR